MEESERPTEFVEEQIHHQALHSKGDRTAWVAVTTAILAALAAVGSLLSSSRSNEAMMLQMQSSDQWSYYPGKRPQGDPLGFEDRAARSSEQTSSAHRKG
jgi:hypothetical protein